MMNVGDYIIVEPAYDGRPWDIIHRLTIITTCNNSNIISKLVIIEPAETTTATTTTLLQLLLLLLLWWWWCYYNFRGISKIRSYFRHFSSIYPSNMRI